MSDQKNSSYVGMYSERKTGEIVEIAQNDVELEETEIILITSKVDPIFYNEDESNNNNKQKCSNDLKYIDGIECLKYYINDYPKPFEIEIVDEKAKAKITAEML